MEWKVEFELLPKPKYILVVGSSRSDKVSLDFLNTFLSRQMQRIHEYLLKTIKMNE